MRSSFAHQDVRSLFISDVHLGSRYCRPEPLTQLLHSVSPEYLYIVGDLCDGWLLRRNWKWQASYAALQHAIARLQRNGTSVTYVLGNHDRCLHRWLYDWGLPIVEQCIHQTVDEKRLLVIHGDQFDATQKQSFRQAAVVTALLHEQVLGGSRAADKLLHDLGLAPRRLASRLSSPLKSWAHRVSQFSRRARQLAELQECCGIICGHTHTPQLQRKQHSIYANCGDWLEHCSLLLETGSGQLELWMSDSPNDWFSECRRIGLLPAESMNLATDELSVAQG